MPISNLKISMNEYMRLVEEDRKKAESGSVYGKLLDNLSNLTEMMQTYFSLDQSGKAPILSPGDYDKLIKGYSEMAKSCNDFLAEEHVKNRLEGRRINMIKRLTTYVEKDLKGMVSADRTKKATLSDVLKEARTRTVDLTGKNLGRIGGSLSNRIPMKNASGTEGFFTKRVDFDYETTREELLNRLAQILPSPFKETFENEAKANSFLMAFEMFQGIDIHSEDSERSEKGFEDLTKLLRTLDTGMSKENIYAMLKEDLEFAHNLQEIHKLFSSADVQHGLNDLAGISDDCRLDQRNAAMSDVASLLGMSNLIARAVPMNIVHDGRVIEGTFMEKAQGEDLNRLSKDSLALQADSNSFNHAAGLKQLADVQILDYICGNVDRHAGNFLYQFEKNDEGKVVLTGVCGIDNDMSFGTELFTKRYSGKELTPLPAIKYMSQSCFEAVTNLSTDGLRLVLRDKLKTEEIDAVCKRVELLRDKMLSKNKENEIKVVEDNAWGKGDYTYDKLSETGISQTIKRAVTSIQTANKYMKDIPENKVSLEYAEGKDVTDEAESRFNEIFRKVDDFMAKSEKLHSVFHRNSAEYQRMMDALKEAKEYGNSIKEKLSKNEDVSLDTYKKFAGKVVNLGLASQTYIAAKNLSQFTDLGKDRYALATDMRDLAQENFAIKETPVKETVERNEPEEEMAF